ncbi:MAG TPA: thioesterase family protein [Xanthobacteraceae bacterium]
MRINRRSVLVEWGDCDPSGVIFNARYFAWFDASLHALLASGGLSFDGLVARHGIDGLPLVETSAKFFTPLRYGDSVVLETAVTKLHRCAFDLHHRVHKADRLAAECFETRVLTAPHPDEGRSRAHPLPQDLVACLTGPAAA